MPYYFTILKDLNLVYKKLAGTYSDDDALSADAEWQIIRAKWDCNTYDMLHDYLDVEEYTVSLKAVRRIADKHKVVSEHQALAAKKLAFVTHPGIAFGTARLYQAQVDSSEMEVEVFSDLASACDWLEIDALDLDRGLVTASRKHE